MGRKSKNIEDRRVSVGVTLPYQLVQCVDNLARSIGVTRTNVFEVALYDFLKQWTEEGDTNAVKTETRL